MAKHRIFYSFCHFFAIFFIFFGFESRWGHHKIRNILCFSLVLSTVYCGFLLYPNSTPIAFTLSFCLILGFPVALSSVFFLRKRFAVFFRQCLDELLQEVCSSVNGRHQYLTNILNARRAASIERHSAPKDFYGS